MMMQKKIAALGILLSAVLIGLLTLAFLGTNKIKSDLTNWKVRQDSARADFNFIYRQRKGTITGMETDIHFNPLFPEKSRINAFVDVNTLSTGVAELDTHLKSPDFFEVESWPRISFLSSKVSENGDGFLVSGSLSIKDRNLPLAFPFKFEQSGAEGMFKGQMLVMAADFDLWSLKDQRIDSVIVDLNVPVFREE